MPDSYSKQASLLTYLGAIPFVICAIAIVFGFEQEKALFVLRAYAAVIVAFISGIHWGIGMKDPQQKAVWLFATSNAISLLAWGSLLMQQAIYALLVIVLSLIFLLIIDAKIYQLRQIDAQFLKLRCRVTLVVVIALLISAVAVV